MSARSRGSGSRSCSREGAATKIVPQGGQVVSRKKAYDLDAMLAGVRPENLHAEVQTGDAIGREYW